MLLHPAPLDVIGLSVVAVFVCSASVSAALEVAVVGAGVTGLTAADWLSDQGHSVTVFEQADHVVPLVQNARINDVLYPYLSVAITPGRLPEPRAI